MERPLPIASDQQLHAGIAPDEETGFGALATARGHLPLAAMDVSATIDGLVSEIDVRQTFVNALDEPLEATYIFPLPDRASVTRFRLRVGTRVIEGALKERAEARRDYDQALQSGYRAAITEEERPGVFTMRVGNIMPGEWATVELTLAGPLPYRDGEATFRFPLVVAPRYIPGIPLPGANVGSGVGADTDAVPDACRINPPVLLPGFPNPVRLTLKVDVHPGTLPLGDMRSSLHAVVENQAGGARRITLMPGERLDRDFILRFRLAEESIKTSLTFKPDDGDSEQGTFVLTVVPPLGLATAARPRDIVFVLDRSGSMRGWKIVAARRAMARMVDSLTERDRFGVLAFDSAVETPSDFNGQALVAATNRNRFRAVEFLAKIHARGGTDMAPPLQRAVHELMAAGSERDRILVLVTDGQIGNEDQILRSLGAHLSDIRVFTLGIDRAVNDGFLKRLAALGGGSCELVESEERLDDVMDQIHRHIGTALLTGLRFEPTELRVEPDSVVPGRLPDLFAGVPLFIMGRYHGPGRGAVTLQATDAAGAACSETATATPSANAALACVWARGRIRELEDRYALGSGELETQIVDTSLRFGVLSRFTAFIAVDKSEAVNTSGQVHQITQPVEVPAGWEEPAGERNDFCFSKVVIGNSPQTMEMTRMLSGLPSASTEFSVPGGTLGARDALPPELARKRSGVVRHAKQRAQTRPPATPVDLLAVRRQAAAILEAFRKTRATDPRKRRKQLHAFRYRLWSFVQDLESIGVPATEFQCLRDLKEQIEKLLARRGVQDAEILEAWDRCEEVLERFSENRPADGPADTQRREVFWK